MHLRALGTAMTNLHIGDCVTVDEHAYVVRGMSPMGAVLRRVQLEDVVSGELVEATVDDVERPRARERPAHPVEPSCHVAAPPAPDVKA